MENKIFEENKITGTHYIIDLFGCNAKQINSSRFLEKVMAESIKGTDIVLMNSAFHTFDPQGVTGFFLLSTSHLSVHSWPEHKYISIDIYSCSDEKTTRMVVNEVLRRIEHKKAVVKLIDRTYNLIPKAHGKRTLTMPVYRDNSVQTIPIDKRIEHITSAFQEIEIVESKEFGKCMLIDGVMQTAESDHGVYDDAILAPLRSEDATLLILGGGDGYVAERALELNPKLHITIVDLDVEVVHAARIHLKQMIFDHPNVTLHIGDALQFLKTNTAYSYNGIVFDLTDNPTLELEDSYESDFRAFYEKILPLAKRRLTQGGWVSVQSGASQVTSDFLDTATIMSEIISKHFAAVTKRNVLIPSFGEENCFIEASVA